MQSRYSSPKAKSGSTNEQGSLSKSFRKHLENKIQSENLGIALRVTGALPIVPTRASMIQQKELKNVYFQLASKKKRKLDPLVTLSKNSKKYSLSLKPLTTSYDVNTTLRTTQSVRHGVLSTINSVVMTPDLIASRETGQSQDWRSRSNIL